MAETVNIDLDACAVPNQAQREQMENGFGALFTPLMALELGMKTAIGNVKRALARCEHGLQRDLCGQCSIHLEIK